MRPSISSPKPQAPKVAPPAPRRTAPRAKPPPPRPAGEAPTPPKPIARMVKQPAAMPRSVTPAKAPQPLGKLQGGTKSSAPIQRVTTVKPRTPITTPTRPARVSGKETRATNASTVRLNPPKVVVPRPQVSPPRVKSAPPRPLGTLQGATLTQAQKNRNVELKGEMATRNKFYRMGYTNVMRLQHDKKHGVDLGALKYKNGQPVAGGIAEIKTRNGPNVGPSVFKHQVRPSYYMPRLEKAQQAGVKGARELYQLGKAGKLTSFGAIYNPQTKGTGAQLYKVPARGPIPSKPIK